MRTTHGFLPPVEQWPVSYSAGREAGKSTVHSSDRRAVAELRTGVKLSACPSAALHSVRREFQVLGYPFVS